MSAFGRKGRRCDWCGKFSKHPQGEYTKPDGVSCGYIRQPEWHFKPDGSTKPEYADSGSDICEECFAGLCPHCGSNQIVRVTPATPGPTGWGGTCKGCGQRWDLAMAEAKE
jgi:hypothetical protein